MTNLYGFDSTDEVKLDGLGLPIGTYKAMAIAETESKDKNTGKTNGVTVEWEVVSGEHKGKKGRVNYFTLHDNLQTSNIAKQGLKRIAEASGKAITQSSPIKGRVITLEVREQKNDPRYTQVTRYLPENHQIDDTPW